MNAQPVAIRELSHQENLVLSLGSSGLLDKEIAREMGVTIDTVRTYWRRIRAKMGNFTRPELASRYVKEASASEFSRLSQELEEHLALEKLLSAALGIAPIGLMLFSAISHLAFVNPCWMQIFSYKYGSRNYKTWGLLAHSELEPFKLDLVERCITSREPVDAELEVRQEKGEPTKLHLNFRPILESEVVIGVICLASSLQISKGLVGLPMEAQAPEFQTCVSGP